MTKGQIRRSLDRNKEAIIFDALVKKGFTALVGSRMLALGHEPTDDTQVSKRLETRTLQRLVGHEGNNTENREITNTEISKFPQWPPQC